MPRTLVNCPYFRRAFGWSVPIGGLAGLIGLGGGEFRLPVLMQGVGFDAKSAVPLNLMVSAVTVGFAIVSRSWSISPTSIIPYLPEVIGLALGGIMSASYGTRLVAALKTERLAQLIACLLAVIGGLLILEPVSPFQNSDLLPPNQAIHFGVGVVFGIGIGLVSSILGVAGGELLIPTLLSPARLRQITYRLALMGWWKRRKRAPSKLQISIPGCLSVSFGALLGPLVGDANLHLRP
jgi:uncharacterized membrane protein YfcA